MKNLLALCLILGACTTDPNPEPMPDAGVMAIDAAKPDASPDPTDEQACIAVPGCEGQNLLCTEAGQCTCHLPESTVHCLRFQPCEQVCPNEQQYPWYASNGLYEWSYCLPSYNRCDDFSKH